MQKYQLKNLSGGSKQIQVPAFGPPSGAVSAPQIPSAVPQVQPQPQQRRGGPLGFLTRDYGDAQLSFLDRLGSSSQEVSAAAQTNRAAQQQALQAQQAAELAKQQRAEQMRQLNQVADQFGLQGRERLAFLHNPEEYAKQASTNYAAANVSAGDSRLVNGQFQTAPAAAYTLGQGQQRFNGNNQQVAQVAPKPQRSFEEEMALRRAGANQTTVNTGNGAPGNRPIVDKPDKGFQRIFDNQSGTYRDIPIPGSNSSQQRERENTTAFRAFEASNIQFDTMKDNIAAARELVSGSTTGLGGLLRDVPASSQRQLRNRLATVQSNIGFDKLQEMRESSPTGGALGQVSEREIDFLQATRGRLDQLSRPADIMQALEEVEASLGRLQEVRRIAYERDHGRIPGESQTNIRPTTSTTLPDGYEVTEEDIAHTMQQHGMTREQVLQRLGGQ